MSPFMVFIKKKKEKKKLTNRINYGKLAARWNGITTCFAIQGSVKVLGRKKKERLLLVFKESSEAESHLIQFHFLSLKCCWIFLELIKVGTAGEGRM